MTHRLSWSRSWCGLLAVACLALAAGCRSSSPAAEVACTCGTPSADLNGCAHKTCLAGKTNPENPDCVCGTLSIPKSK